MTLDEPALRARCGASRTARMLALACVLAGPGLLLRLCFQLGELGAKLSLREPRRLLLLCRAWDFSFGQDEPPPPELRRKVAAAQSRTLIACVACAACAELLLSYWGGEKV